MSESERFTLTLPRALRLKLLDESSKKQIKIAELIRGILNEHYFPKPSTMEQFHINQEYTEKVQQLTEVTEKLDSRLDQEKEWQSKILKYLDNVDPPNQERIRNKILKKLKHDPEYRWTESELALDMGEDIDIVLIICMHMVKSKEIHQDRMLRFYG